jgi:outer membrane receptor for Fe3+-dicitrate
MINAFTYLNTEIKLGKLLINPAVRLDYFKFNYRDKLVIYKTQTESEVKISPKLNFIYSQNNNLQFFVKSGIGFHSNDARVVVQNNGKHLHRNRRRNNLETFPRLIVNSALWYLYLQQEFVYVGDAGIIEPREKRNAWG